MNRIHHILALAVLSAAIFSVDVAAQRHQGANRSERKEMNGGNSSSTSPSSVGRPAYGTRPEATSPSRPSNNGNSQGRPGSDRPNQGNNNHGNQGNHNGWGNNNNNGNQGNHNHGNNGNHGGWGNGNHGYRPGGNHSHRPDHIDPPHRPNRPNMHRPHVRPMPPHAWHPSHRLPLISGVLGLAFGIDVHSALDYLYHRGYSIDGYGDNTVYLRNVPMLGYIWTDAALYYGYRGLDASSFYYTTTYYDMTRYNNVYSRLSSEFGAPVAFNNSGSQISSTWFGGNQGYVTLTFAPAPYGRFITTLTYGM